MSRRTWPFSKGTPPILVVEYLMSETSKYIRIKLIDLFIFPLICIPLWNIFLHFFAIYTKFAENKVRLNFNSQFIRKQLKIKLEADPLNGSKLRPKYSNWVVWNCAQESTKLFRLLGCSSGWLEYYISEVEQHKNSHKRKHQLQLCLFWESIWDG